MAYKIYLSPSDQLHNPYATGGTNEMVQCDKIAKAAYSALTRCGFSVKVGKSGDSMANKCRESDAFGADIHMPIHTNAANGAITGGTLVMVGSDASKAKKAGNALLKAVGAISPGSDYTLRVVTDLYEISVPKALSVYLEVEFHDTIKGSNWIQKNISNIGEAIAKGMCSYFGVTYKAPNGTTFLYTSSSTESDGPIMIGHASTDANARPEQVLISEYNASSFGTSVVIRAKEGRVADAIAAAAEAGCNNDKIGYSQATRMSLYEEAKKVDYDLSKITVECEADCASFVWLCAVAGAHKCGIKIDHTSWPPCTINMRDFFEPYHDHFDILDSEQYTSGENVQRGDIVVDEDRHTGIIVSGESSAAVIKINAKISNIKTTSISVGVTVTEKKYDTEETIQDKEWLSNYYWTYELERLSSTKVEKIGPKKINVGQLSKFSIESLVPNNTYRLKISMSTSTDSSADKLTSQGFIFSTLQDYPESVKNLIFTLEKIDDALLLNKTCTISFSAPKSWGTYATNRPDKGYRVNIVLNGKTIDSNDALVTVGSSSINKVISLGELTKNVELKYKDTLQIGVQSWVKDEKGNYVFDNDRTVCSQPIYLKYFLDDIDKMYLDINNVYKRALLLDPDLEIKHWESANE